MVKQTTPVETQPEEQIDINIDGIIVKAKKKEFKSGRHGWGAYGMIKIKNYPHRVSINLIEVA